MSTPAGPPAAILAASTALALLLAACGQTISPERSGDPAAVDEGPAAAAEPVRDEAVQPEDDRQPADEPSGQPGDPETDGSEHAEPAPQPQPTAEASGPDETGEAATADGDRVVATNDFTPFATVAGITLHHPSSRVERVGFHQANHDGARQLEVAGSAIAPMTLEGRGRATGSRSAADIVVDPAVEVRSPVTGTVLRAGTYVLYCDYADDYVVIEPDARPGWEVKLLHIDGVRVEQGHRVEAGRSVLAPRPTPLPFASQVDEHTAEPSWPHVHIEVVDPSIPNESTGGGC